MPTYLRTDAPWGLARLSCDSLGTTDADKLDFQYKFHRTAGTRVNIYVLDSAVNVEHVSCL